jgi:glyoxalase family protein
MGTGGVHAEVHVIVRNDLPRTRYGAGGVHHVALRVPPTQQMTAWVDRIGGAGYGNSGIVDRHYFTSLYVRERNGVLFELATDGPGFAVDHPLDGDMLSLPPFLEPHREEIAAALAPLNTSEFAART